VFEEFSGQHVKELLDMMDKDDDLHIKEEFIYPYKMEQLDGEYLRSIFSSYRLRNDKYAALRISIQTDYGWKIPIGTAHIVQQNSASPKALLGKFYVCKIYRRSGYEERCLLEIMKFAFDVMNIDKLIAFVNERNQYFYKLLLYVGFRLIKLKPKNHGLDNRLMLSIVREDYEKVTSTKSYNRIIRNKFYNNYLHNA
jgi:RimJ/RimL family protein N-acetyltransferase